MFKKLYDFFLSLFKNKSTTIMPIEDKKEIPVAVTPPSAPALTPPTPPPPLPLPTPVVTEEIDWVDWASKAAYISSTFEGKGGDYANVTGNFDGAYLTCGLLGLTWKWGNQTKIIDKYLIKHGPNPLLKLMPKTGQEYLEAVNAGEKGGSSIVAAWSGGSHKVRQPYRAELSAFWSSPEMVVLQNQTYEKMMGVFAKKMAIEAQKYFKLDKPLFEHYAYYWDQAVLNGTGNTIPFEAASAISTKEVLDFVETLGGFNKSSNQLNAKLWKEQIHKVSPAEIHLFKLAYLRALKSKTEFRGTTLMRRGTLALGIGYVNESLRKYDWA